MQLAELEPLITGFLLLETTTSSDFWICTLLKMDYALKSGSHLKKKVFPGKGEKKN